MLPHPTDLAPIVDNLRPELVALLQQSVRTSSLSGHEQAVAELHRSWIAARGWPVELRPLTADDGVPPSELADGRGNVVARFGSDGLPRIVLNGHLDVVDAGDPADWSADPFSGEQVDGAIYGRGSADMKGGIVAALWALRALEQAGVELRVQVELQLVVGEETTGVGTRALLAQDRWEDPLGVVVLEPTGNRIVAVNTGVQFFTVEVAGRASHTSAPWDGVDAFANLLLVRDAMLAVADRRAAAYDHPAFAAVPTALPFAIGTVRAGAHRAAVPATATMSGRIGLAPGERIADVRSAFVDAITAACADDAWLTAHPPRINWDNEGLPGWETSTGTPLLRAIRGAQKQLHGSASTVGFTAGSDAGQFGGRGIPTIVFGPGDVALAHAPDEHVRVDDVERAALVLATTLAGLR
ncbi:MAG: ArgE/DapE family deacylase [Patulibacter sp.]